MTTRPSTKNPSPIVGLAAAVVLVLCCGGAIASFSGDDQPPSASQAAKARAEGLQPEGAPEQTPPTPSPDQPVEPSESPTPEPTLVTATRKPTPATTTRDPAPTSTTRKPAPATTTRKPAPATTTRKPAPTSTARKSGPYYKNCDAARAAGVAPLFRGEPGYRPELDRDGDGEACEPGRGNGDRGELDHNDGNVYYANCTAVRAAGKAPIRRGDPGYSRRLDRDGDGIACE
ncbi:excalibur calcium-binding domain-containing protein [Micromonospora sp. SH-82]|uniref:excalibur calcium-binding domain-containing protein n=1 Tax=Micromonospora sp. SH-82 TaxID=3132938 RepID=UPI003EBC7ADC